MAAKPGFGAGNVIAALVLTGLLLGVSTACGSDSAADLSTLDNATTVAPSISESSDGPDATTGLESTAARTAASEPAFLLPDATSPGTEIRTAHVTDGTPDSEPVVAVFLGTPSESGIDDVVVVVVSEADRDREVGGDEGSTPVDINGTEARIGEVSSLIVDWYEDGRAVSVFGPAGGRELVLAVARAVDPTAEGDAIVTAVPDTHELLQSMTYPSSDPEAPVDDGISWSVLFDRDGSSLTMTRSWSPGPDIGLLLHAVGAAEARFVEVRGVQGVRVSRSLAIGDPDLGGSREVTMVSLSWMETPQSVVTLEGDTDIETLRAVAESLVPASREELERFDLPVELPADPSTPG